MSHKMKRPKKAVISSVYRPNLLLNFSQDVYMKRKSFHCGRNVCFGRGFDPRLAQ